ncbi:YcxB family protein [Pontibacter sp. E15-1]|uniref:YcxB family protein n=1 Tax=Pontibacter sp. E15-1 TaxID=2919918 RepID=UPI001F500672|nr:YcxB family protein [Pontibacter sp. E15-1]MCJ8164103.1 YcxB family protein [Pontibacter sp. E15-1]
MVQVSAQLTQQDFIRFNFRYFFSRPLVKVFVGVLGFAFLISLLGTVLTGISEYEQGNIIEQGMSLLILPGMVGLICWGVYSQSKRSYATTSSVHEPITYTFSGTGVHLKGSSFESDLTWKAFHKVQETKQWFILFQNSSAANLVPKAAMESEEHLQTLRKLIASHKHLKHKLLKQ